MSTGLMTLRQIADATKLPFERVRKRSFRENWQAAAESVINHKNTRLFAVATLPEDIRLKLEPAQLPLVPVTASLPVEMPEAARKTALARFDLLRHWQDWRNSFNGPVAQADAAFAAAYQNAYPIIFAVLGEVSVKTLYRWQSMLDDSADWTRLAPAYYGRGRGGVPELETLERNLFMGALLNPNRISIGKAITLVKYMLQQKDITVKHSAASFRRYAEHFKAHSYDVWVSMRDGKKALNDQVSPFAHRDPRLLNVGDVLVSDGHRLNFQVINPFTGKPCRATIIVYLDWKSYYPAGYYIMLEENTQCIAAAFRSAVLNLGKIPKVCYQDNGKAFRSKFFEGDVNLKESGLDGLFARLGIHAVFAKPYNAKAKIIENWWHNVFGETFERLMPSYTGASIADKPAWLSRNEKWHKAHHDSTIPTIPQVVERIALWLSLPTKIVCGQSIFTYFKP